MVSAISSAISGFAAAAQRLNVSAQNIANSQSTETEENGGTVNTPYVPLQLVQSSQASGGVTTSTEPVSPASIPVYDPDSPSANSSGVAQLPNVDPAQQLVQANIATYNAQGNLAVIKAQEQMNQQILNIVS